LVDKLESVLSGDEMLAGEEALSAFIYAHYKNCAEIPPRVLLSFQIDEEDKEALSASLSAMAGRRVQLHTPERGELRTLCELAVSNARERATVYLREHEKSDGAAVRLAELLSLEVVPERIESYDISNFGKEHKTCGMIVMENGVFKKSDYRTFRIREVEGTDDYASMREALSRRFGHLGEDEAKFGLMPDLILLDGGKTHVAAVRQVAAELGVTVPIFGMVKDDFHKTRALCGEVEEISIAKEQDVFHLIYRIQEEVHRYAIGRMSQSKRGTLRTSELQKIPGVGAAKAKLILKHFGGLAAIKRASEQELADAPGVGPVIAAAVYAYFHGKDGEEL
jgi:excinuclease ABC subunit C